MTVRHMWHKFTPSSDDDNECTNRDCGVIVSDDCLAVMALPCPAPPCGDDSNDGPCVIVRDETGGVCAYCGRAAMRDTGFDDEDDEEDDFE